MTDLKALAGRVAKLGLPMLGARLGGPLGEAAMGAVAGALGLAPDAPAGAVEAALDKARPEDLVALARLDADMERERMAHEERQTAAALGDVQHARASDRDDTMRRLLGPIFVAMPMGTLCLLLWLKPTGELLGAAMLVLGLAIGLAERVANFHFGTSIGSKKRAEEIAQMTGGK